MVNGANFYVKDGRQTFKGVELSLTGNLTQDLSVYASALFLDAKYTSRAPTNLTRTPISPTPGRSPRGEYAEDHLVGRRRIPLDAGSSRARDQRCGLLRGGPGDQSDQPGFIPGYTLFDLGGSYTTEVDRHKLTFRINGENIGGKRYWASTGGLLLAQGAPSTIKFSIGTVF